MGEKQPSRIQMKNRAAIMDAALQVFSTEGFRGATLDQIAGASGLSKPNVLYYFSSKEAIYEALLSTLLDDWLEPLHQVNGDGDPIEELVAYIMLKLKMSRVLPRESRLFANEILRGAPNIIEQIEGPLRALAAGTGSTDDLDVTLTFSDGLTRLGFLPLGPAPSLVIR